LVHKQKLKKGFYCPHCGDYLDKISGEHDEYDLLKRHLKNRTCSSKKAMIIYGS